MKALTAAQVASFHNDGFLYPIPALAADELAYFLVGVERLETELGCPVAEADVKWRSHGYAHSPWFNELIRHPRILDAVEDVIGPDILVWTSTFFIKEPGSKTFAAWHQDGAFFGLEPHEQVCAWVALTDASREAGCMEMLSAKGAPRMLHHEAKGIRNSINRAGQTIVEPFDKRRPTAMALNAGEFSLHHELAVHRSAPNHARASPRRYRPQLLAAACPGEQPGAAQGDAGARRGPSREFRADRPAARRARRRGAGVASGDQRPLSREL